MKWMLGWLVAASRSRRNVFSATGWLLVASGHFFCHACEHMCLHGHPQCLRNAITTGLPSDCGILRALFAGACLPISGGDERSTFGGVSQEYSSCFVVILDQCIE